MMKLIIPEQFKKIVGSSEIDASGKTVEEVIYNLINEFPDIRPRLFNEEGKLNRFINVYVNDEDIRFLNGILTEVYKDDTITLLPSIAGG